MLDVSFNSISKHKTRRGGGGSGGRSSGSSKIYSVNYSIDDQPSKGRSEYPNSSSHALSMIMIILQRVIRFINLETFIQIARYIITITIIIIIININININILHKTTTNISQYYNRLFPLYAKPIAFLTSNSSNNLALYSIPGLVNIMYIGTAFKRLSQGKKGTFIITIIIISIQLPSAPSSASNYHQY